MSIKYLTPKLNTYHVGTAVSLRKPTPHAAINGGGLVQTSGKFGWYYTRMGTHKNDLLYAFHAEKTRAKFKVEKTFFKSGPKKGQVKGTTVVHVRQGGWKLRVFAFPIDRIVHFKQLPRHFEIILK